MQAPRPALCIAVVVNAMQSCHDAEEKHAKASHEEHTDLLAETRALRAGLQALKSEREGR